METKDPIEELREWAASKDGMGISPGNVRKVIEFADEIEAAYMKLPVDADGVPIRIGDRVQMELGKSAEVIAVSISRWFFHNSWLAEDGDGYAFEWANKSRHVNVESVLAQFLTACGDDDPHYYDEQIAAFAERIREAVKHER